jgi:hypothetical protein
MVDTDKLTKERERAVKREEVKAGVRDEWFYKVDDGKVVRWFKTSLTFYPKTTWWVQEYSNIILRGKKIGKRVKLTDDLKARLEDWL